MNLFEDEIPMPTVNNLNKINEELKTVISFDRKSLVSQLVVNKVE